LRGIYIDDNPSGNEKELAARIRRMVRVYKVRVIFLDYIQLAEISDKNSNQTEGLGKIAMMLKNLAKELMIAIVPLIQAGRDTEKGVPRAPTLADIQWADKIGQSLDVLISLFKPDLYEDNPVDEDGSDLKGCMIINYAKHRGGPSGPDHKKIVPFNMALNSIMDVNSRPVLVKDRHKKEFPISPQSLF